MRSAEVEREARASDLARPVDERWLGAEPAGLALDVVANAFHQSLCRERVQRAVEVLWGGERREGDDSGDSGIRRRALVEELDFTQRLLGQAVALDEDRRIDRDAGGGARGVPRPEGTGEG